MTQTTHPPPGPDPAAPGPDPFADAPADLPGGERLYRLLPAIYRIRDVAAGRPLEALLGVIGEELDRLDADVEGLYDNWFIETCDEWVVPYLGDLLGVRGAGGVTAAAVADGSPGGGRPFSRRAFVANTLAYRRGKGTAATLELLARDVTGWPARAVEFFLRLTTTQYLNHVRLANVATVDVRDPDAMERLGSPFESANHTADVRHVDNGRGRYNIPNVGLFLWRLQSYPVARGEARPVASPPDGRYTFNPFGLTAPLFNRPRTETDSARLAEEFNAPGPLRRWPLHAELQARRADLVAGQTARAVYFADPPVVRVHVRGPSDADFAALAPEELVVCDLSDPPAGTTDWNRPTPQALTRPDGTTVTARVAVDPVLGRLALPPGDVPRDVLVDYAYGFAGDLGGGPYDRRASLLPELTRASRTGRADEEAPDWQLGVTRDAGPGDPDRVATLGEAIDRWNSLPPGRFGVIAVLDSRTYAQDLTAAARIRLPADSRLVIVAGTRTAAAGNAGGVPARVIPSGVRPHVLGSIEVEGTAPPGVTRPGELVLNGLWVEGGLTVLPGNLAGLRLAHCTLAPSAGGALVAQAGAGPGLGNEALAVGLDRCVCGPVRLADPVPRLRVTESILQTPPGGGGGGAGATVDAPGAAGEVVASTVLGTTVVKSLQASNSIFTGRVRAARRQVGCVRFCYLPLNSVAPRRFKCQPANPAVAGRVVPQFTAVTFGRPGYGQLSAACPPEIAAGADDDGEMGAFHFLQQPQRLAALRTAFDEYLPFRLEAGTFFVT